MAKRLILVEIDVDEGDPKRCGQECPWQAKARMTYFGQQSRGADYCFGFQEISDGIRCLQCLDAETAAHMALKGGE